VTETLTDPTVADLVDAHLGINYSYFGAIDKTLSGFVILDNTGDDYTLLDLRDGGQVWFQDHETRDVVLRSDKVAKPTRRVVSTPELCARYQWLVWMLARPLQQHGKPIQAVDYLVRCGIGRFRHVWPRREPHDAAFAAELGALRDDPHLAIYWLLHTTVFADHDRRRQVVEAIGPPACALVRAFVTRLGMLPLGGDLPIVPEFRARRALAVTYGAFELAVEDVPRACLLALELSPGTSSIMHGLQVLAGLDKGLDAAIVTGVLARIPEVTAGTELVRAVLDKRAGLSASSHADAVARFIGTTDLEPWWFALEAMWQTHELAYDAPALVAATRAIVARDCYHRRALQMAMRAAQMAGEPSRRIDAIEAELALADAILAPFQRLAEEPRAWETTVAALAGKPAERALAWRVLQRAQLNKPPPALAAWAARKVVDDPAGVALVSTAFASLDTTTQSGVVDAIASAIDRADHPLVEVLLACVDGSEPADHDHAAQFALKRAKEAALVALAPWFSQLFDRLMVLVERPASGAVVDLFWAKLFSPFQKETYVLGRLDAAQAVRVARAMIATQLRHPSIHARNAAGHQLYKFSHPGAETFLVDALTEYAVRYAAVKGPGGVVLDHGKTENDQLEDVVSNLYAAVRNLGTPASREALIERLFAERRAYWRMGNALAEIWSSDVHARVMALLAERRDPRAAGCYAYALHDFVKKGAPLVDLARLVREWQGDTEVARGFLHYALVVGIDAALAARDYDLVRLAHESAAWIAEPPIEPDAHARDRAWQNPLEDEATKAALAAALSGEAEAAKQELVAAAAERRTKRKPNLQISDDALGQLAGAKLVERVLHDRKTGAVWFRDAEGLIRYFDGYSVVAAPFVATRLGLDGIELAARELADRALWWDARAEHFRDVMRLGSTLLLSWGVNNGSFERYALTFADDAAAAAAMAQLRANAPKGYRESDPYYLAGRGAVVRTYYVRAGAGAERKREVIAVLDGVVDDVDLGSDAAGAAEHARREAAWLAGGGVLACVEWMDNRRRRTDLTVREWIAKRCRDDKRDAAWHVEALAEIAQYLQAHRVAVRLETTIVAPARAADIAAFAAARTQPIPDVLAALWAQAGGASWTLGERGARFLGPLDVLARRPVARAAAEAYLAKLPPANAERLAPVVKALDVLVETLDGVPMTFVADMAAPEHRVFTHAADHPNDFWWEKSLSWMLATGLLGDLEDAIATAAPVVERIKYGAQIAAAKRPAAKQAAKKPAAKQPPARKLAKPAKKPVKKPAAKKPVKKPAAKKPAVKKPAAKKPAAKTPRPRTPARKKR